MFTNLISNDTETIDRQIERAVRELNTHPVMSEDYGDILDLISRLQKLKDAESKHRTRISPDTLILAVTNLLGIAMIIRHEQFNVMSSKATGFVMKPR